MSLVVNTTRQHTDEEVKILMEETLVEMTSLETGWEFKPAEWDGDLANGPVAWYIAYKTQEQ